MTLGRRVTLGVLWMGAAQVARRLSGLLITAILARLLVPEDFGLVAIATAVLGILALLSEMGFAAALVQRPDVSESHLRTAFTASFTLSVIAAGVGVGLSLGSRSLLDDSRAIPLFWGLLATLPLLSLAQVPDALLQRRLAFKQIAMIEWGAAVISGIAGVAAAFAGLGAWALVVQGVVSAVCLSVCKAIAAGWLPRFGFRTTCARDLSAFGFSVLGGALINHLGANIDYLIIAARLGAESLGYYVMAFNLAMLPASSISGVITRVMFPALSSVNQDRNRLCAAYIKIVRVVSLCAPPVIVGLAVVAPLVVPMIYGPKWTLSIPLVQALSVVGGCLAMSTAGLLLYAVGRPLALLGLAAMYPPLIATAVYVGSHWGLTAAAVTYACVAPAHFLVVHLSANRLGGVPTVAYLRALAPSLIACAVMAATCSLALRGLRTVTDQEILLLAAVVGIGVLAYATVILLIARVAGHSWRTLPKWALGETATHTRG